MTKNLDEPFDVVLHDAWRSACTTLLKLELVRRLDKARADHPGKHVALSEEKS